MNLKKALRVKLPHGTLQLRVYDLRSTLTVLPDVMGEPIFKREYQYWEAARAEQDYETLRRVYQEQVETVA